MKRIAPHSELVRIDSPRARNLADPLDARLESASPVDTGASLNQLIELLSRHRWKLLILVGSAVLAAVLVQIFVPKMYEATALVKVDRHAAAGVIGQAASQVSSVDDMERVMATQIELAKSDPVLRPVAERFNLLEVEGQLKGLSPEKAALRRLAPVALRRMAIARPPNSYLLRISYRAHDPQLAANVANALAESLSEHANDTEKHSSERISSLVEQSMSALRDKMESSSKVLTEYEKQLNMVDPEQRATIQTARLAQLNTDFTTAQAERVRRQAILAEVQSSNNLASAQAAQAAAQDTLLNEAVQRLNAAIHAEKSWNVPYDKISVKTVVDFLL